MTASTAGIPMEFSANFDVIGRILQICLIDLLLSGDNAILIALACRELPADVRRSAVWLGTGAAVGFRVILTFAATLALRAPYLKLIGAILLLLIAIELFAGEARHRKPAGGQGANAGLWRAIMVIVVADAVMSMDNVVAVAAAAQDNFLYLVLGLLISIPILVSSSLLVARALDAFPILVEAGAALLGWIAGETAVADPAIAGMLDTQSFGLAALAPVLGAAYVIVQGRLLRARRRQANAVTPPDLGAAAPQFASIEATGAAAMAMHLRAASGESVPVARGVVILGRRMSPMDLTIMAGVAVPLLGLVAMVIYLLAQAFTSHH